MFPLRNRQRLPTLALHIVLVIPIGMFLSIAIGACGPITPSNQTASLDGLVILYPSKPVCSDTEACNTPFADREVAITAADGHVAATVTTDQQGRFTATLRPGAYVVRVVLQPGLPGRRQ